MEQTRILALIPAYNESAHIADVVARAGKHLPVLVVDDGSKDDTSAVAKNAGAEVVRQVPNQGKGVALQNGLRYALEMGYDAVITLDADGQHAPEEIPLFVKNYEQLHSDLVIGCRNFKQMPLVRRCSNTLGTWMFSWAVGQPVRDNQSGYRLISSRLIREILDSRENGFEYEVEMIVRCVQQKMKLDWVPIQTIYADEHSHIHPLHHAYHFMRVVVQTRKAIFSAR